MKRPTIMTLAVLLALPLAVSAADSTWKNVSMLDTSCASRVKADPDKHTTQCAIKCEKGGYGLLDADGNYLKFDAAGNEKAVAALKATKKTDHLRVTVVGEKDGATVKVKSLSFE